MVYGDKTGTGALGLFPEFPDSSVEVRTVNAMLLLHARARVQRRSGRWRPYAEGLFGFNNLSTETSIPGDLDCTVLPCSQSTVTEATNAQDVVLSYGAGAGLMIVFRPAPGFPKLDLSARYLRGGEAEYLTEGAIRVVDGQVILDVSRSRTDTVAFYIGVAFGR